MILATMDDVKVRVSLALSARPARSFIPRPLKGPQFLCNLIYEFVCSLRILPLLPCLEDVPVSFVTASQCEVVRHLMRPWIVGKN